MLKFCTDAFYQKKESTSTSPKETNGEVEKNDEEEETREDEEILPLVMKELTPALKEEAREQLNETEEVKTKALDEFRQLIENEKKLVTITDDIFLLAFLRSRQFDVKKSFKLLQNYFKFRKDYDAIFSQLDTAEGDNFFLRNYGGLLKHRDRNGCAVFVAKVGLWDPDEFSYETLFNCITAALVYTQQHEATQVAGIRAIFDLRDITWKHMKYITPSTCLLILKATQCSYPAIYKGLHIVCESKFVNFLWGMLYPLIPSKLKQIIFIHGEDLKPLRKYVHPSVLPEDYGGYGPPLSNDFMVESLNVPDNYVLRQIPCGYRD